MRTAGDQPEAHSIIDGDIAVFVDGSRDAWSAFDWAHDEARRTGRRLRVAHAVPHSAERAAASGDGDEVLAEAAARLADIDSPVQVTTHRYRESFQDAVSHVSERAALVVVGSGTRHLLQPRLIGRAHGLLGRTSCPLVVVTGARSHPWRRRDDRRLALAGRAGGPAVRLHRSPPLRPRGRQACAPGPTATGAWTR